MARTMIDATRFNLINQINEKTGASVGMWRGVHCAPIEWAAWAKSATRIKRSAPLTVTKATAQARRIADRILPNMGPEVSVSSHLSHDLISDRPTVVTTITFPPSTARQDIADMDDDLHMLPGWCGSTVDSTRITITRFR